MRHHKYLICWYLIKMIVKVVMKMNIIRKKRKALGISQSELSEKLGTSQQTISRIEKAGIENIPCNLLIKLADIFHVPIDILIYEEQNNLFSSQGEELWEIYKQLDEANKTTLLTLGRRLSEAQVENMFKRQMGDESDKNSDM